MVSLTYWVPCLSGMAAFLSRRPNGPFYSAWLLHGYRCTFDSTFPPIAYVYGDGIGIETVRFSRKPNYNDSLVVVGEFKPDRWHYERGSLQVTVYGRDTCQEFDVTSEEIQFI
jgi:hypothetical protein